MLNGMSYTTNYILENFEIKPLMNFKRALSKVAFFTVNTFFQPSVVASFNPEFVFAAYGTERESKYYFSSSYKHLMQSTLLCSKIDINGRTGLMVASRYLEDELVADRYKILSYIHDLPCRFPSAKNFALVGRLPNFVKRTGVAIDRPFVDGSMGTRYMIYNAFSTSMIRGQPGRSVVVLGGAGRVGELVCQDLLKIFRTVVAFDSRYSEDVIQDGNNVLIKTSNVEKLKQFRLFVCLTDRGDSLQSLLDYIPTGSVIADDTHPCISPVMRDNLQKKGVNVLKIVTCHDSFRMTPRMPDWQSNHVPGCLVEALVLLEDSSVDLSDLEKFSKAADRIGFKPDMVVPSDF